MKEGIDYEISYESNVNAGEAKIKINGKNGYTFAEGIDFIILPKEVTLNWENADNYEYDGSLKTMSATVGGLVGTDKCYVKTYSGTTSEKDAGSYTTTATELSNTNYVLPKEASKEWTIAKKSIEINGSKKKISG